MQTCAGRRGITSSQKIKVHIHIWKFSDDFHLGESIKTPTFPPFLSFLPSALNPLMLLLLSFLLLIVSFSCYTAALSPLSSDSPSYFTFHSLLLFQKSRHPPHPPQQMAGKPHHQPLHPLTRPCLPKRLLTPDEV